jgi:hypothetical protein
MDGRESAVWHIGGSSTPRRRRSILNPRIAKCSLTKMSLQTSDVCPETLRAQFLARPPSFLILSSDPSSCSISCISLSAKSRHVRAMQKATWSQRGLNVIVCKKTPMRWCEHPPAMTHRDFRAQHSSTSKFESVVHYSCSMFVPKNPLVCQFIMFPNWKG